MESADHRTAETNGNGSRIVIGVPGPWKERGDLIEALLGAHGGAYLFAGLVFMETATRLACQMDWYEHDDPLRTAFTIAGQGKLSEALLDAVGGHESTAYLVFDDAGYETARTAARFAGALLRAGGIAVKVETAGRIHRSGGWKPVIRRKPGTSIRCSSSWWEEMGAECRTLRFPTRRFPHRWEPRMERSC